MCSVRVSVVLECWSMTSAACRNDYGGFCSSGTEKRVGQACSSIRPGARCQALYRGERRLQNVWGLYKEPCDMKIKEILL